MNEVVLLGGAAAALFLLTRRSSAASSDGGGYDDSVPSDTSFAGSGAADLPSGLMDAVIERVDDLGQVFPRRDGNPAVTVVETASGAIELLLEHDEVTADSIEVGSDGKVLGADGWASPVTIDQVRSYYEGTGYVQLRDENGRAVRWPLGPHTTTYATGDGRYWFGNPPMSQVADMQLLPVSSLCGNSATFPAEYARVIRYACSTDESRATERAQYNAAALARYEAGDPQTVAYVDGRVAQGWTFERAIDSWGGKG